MLEKIFDLKANGTSVRQELRAGLTSFMAMCYLIFVVPSMLADAGMPRESAVAAVIWVTIAITLLMGLWARFPVGVAPGLGITAFFAYYVCGPAGYSWQTGLGAVFISGVFFMLLTVTRVRQMIIDAVPMDLKYAIVVGIGAFIAFIGLQNCGVVVDSSTLVAMYNFSANAGEFSTVGITVALAMVGILLTAVLMVRKVKGHILWGMLATWALGILCQLIGLYDPSVKGSLLPDFSGGFGVPSLMPTLGQMDFSKTLTSDFALVVFAFLFVDLFDTLGGIMGMAAQSDLLDKKGRLPRLKGALLSDAVGTTAGAVLGTSTVTTFAESAAGMAEGGRTGLTGLFSAALFALSLFLSPIFLAIPSFATAPALVVVGFLMMGSIRKVDFSDCAQAIPAFLCVAAMPFLYSISEGIALGVISYVVIHLAAGGEKRRSLNPALCVLAVLFILKYFFF